jgi:hypothetical protein
MNRTKIPQINESMKKRLLPIGMHTSSEIIEDRRVYVDKTGRVYDLVKDLTGTSIPEQLFIKTVYLFSNLPDSRGRPTD